MKAKYKCGKQIRTVADFEKSKSKYYKVEFGGKNVRTIHMAFLISWQYQMLRNFIQSGRIWEAEPTDENDGIHGFTERRC